MSNNKRVEIDFVKEAVKLQTPKNIKFNRNAEVICPTCTRVLKDAYQNYCHYCGQKLAK